MGQQHAPPSQAESLQVHQALWVSELSERVGERVSECDGRTCTPMTAASAVWPSESQLASAREGNCSTSASTSVSSPRAIWLSLAGAGKWAVTVTALPRAAAVTATCCLGRSSEPASEAGNESVSWDIGWRATCECAGRHGREQAEVGVLAQPAGERLRCLEARRQEPSRPGPCLLVILRGRRGV